MVAKKIRIDFSKVEERSGWNTAKMPEGLHEFKIVDVVDQESSQDGTDMYVFSLQPTAAKYKTRNFPFYCKLQPNQYWKLRDLLTAAGINVPKKVNMIDPNKAIGKKVACEIVDASGQYEGRSEINGVFSIDVLDDTAPSEDVDDSDDEEEYEDAEEEFEDDADEDEEGDDEELLAELEGLTLPALRKRAKELGISTAGLKQPDLIEAILEEELGGDDEDEDDEDLDDEELEDEDLEDEDFDEDEDDEEEEEPEPAPRRRAAPARKPAAKAAPARKAPAKAAAEAPKRTIRRR